MAKYTMELRSIQADFYNAMQSYPIFDESYREQLNDKIYHALKYREIGYETPELFCEMLEQWMDLNMPEYNWLYKSNLIELTPLQRARLIEIFNGTVDTKEDSTTNNNVVKTLEGTETNTNQNETAINGTITVEEEGTDNTTSSQNSTDSDTSNGSDSNVSYHSDFPQANLEDSNDSNYYSTGDRSNGTNHSESSGESSVNGNSETTRSSDSTTETDSTTTVNGTSTDTTNTTENETGEESYDMTGKKVDSSIRERTGNEGKTDFELLSEYRKSFLNVDAKLIRALKRELFMNIW